MPSASRAPSLRRALPLFLLAALALVVVRLAGSARLEPADMAFNNGTEVQTLDPATVSGVPEGRILRAIFEGLVMKDPRTLEPVPGVAESWELSPDGHVYTFRIREGARWTNGDPLTAHDFEFSWERFLHPRTAAEYAYQLWYVRGGRPYTLVPDERSFAAGAAPSSWVRALSDGRVALGLCGFLLEGQPLDAPIPALPALGAHIEAGATLFELPGGSVRAPLAGRVRAVNAALPATLGELRQDPYQHGWWIELETEPGAFAAAHAAGALLDAPTFRRELAWPAVGIRALDAHTLRVELEHPTPYFLSLCAFYPLYPVNRRNLEEARERWPGSWEIEWLRPENLVTNGPFRVAFRRVNDRLRLVKNEHYWDADAVAFDTIDALAVDHLGTSLNLYLTGGIDWIDRPQATLIPRLMPREDFNPALYLGSYFYRFNCTKPPFDDPRVRRALSLSIDRRAICERITKAGEQPSWTFVPPVLPGYPRVELRRAGGGYAEGLAADLEEARRLMAEAGFGPGGRPFPTFEIHFNTDQTHKDVAEVIGDGWARHLGLNVRYLNQEWKVYLDTQKTITYDVSRSAWIGDYPDPNTFLDMFVTSGENNRTGWSDLEYDDFVRRAALEPDPARRYELLASAERILMDQLPILPIYSYVTKNLANPRLGGFFENFQDEHFPKHWYWKDDAELAAQRAELPADAVLVPARGPAEGKRAPAQRRAAQGARR